MKLRWAATRVSVALLCSVADTLEHGVWFLLVARHSFLVLEKKNGAILSGQNYFKVGRPVGRTHLCQGNSKVRRQQSISNKSFATTATCHPGHGLRIH